MALDVVAPIRRDPPSVEIQSLEWQRIQLVIRARLCSGELTDAAGFVLRSQEAPTASMTATHATLDGTELTLRFNVMQGPDQQPLEPGRWLLSLRHGEGATTPIAIANFGAVDLDRAGRDFAFRQGTYRASATVDAADRALAVEILLEPRIRGARRAAWQRLRRRVKRARRLTGLRRRVFRLLLRFYRLASRRNGRRILFTSDSRSELSGNLEIVHDRMVERGLDRRYELVGLFKPNVAARRSWTDRLRMPWLLAKADVILVDDYQPIIYRFDPDPDLRIIQLWHASGAFKTVGYSRVGKPGGLSPYSRTHKNYTHAIVSSQFDVPYYAEAFGIPEERVIPTGIPRMDRFFNEEMHAAGREAAQVAFPQIKGRTVILFAPTFRGRGPRDAYYDFERIDFAALHRLSVEKDAVVIIKMHPFVRTPVPILNELRDRLLDGATSSIDVNDLLFAVDLLITDYSSIVFEYSTLDRPMLFFAYDLDEYVASRDFYVPFEEFVPGRIARSFDELLDAIRRGDYEAHKVRAFAHRHFDHLDGASTDRVIDELILAR